MWRCSPMFLLLGCRPPDAAPCPSFEETEIVDEVGVPNALEEVRQAFADFSSWTSRAGVCIEQVALVDEVPVDGASGQYTGDRVLVEPGPFSVRETTLHELCHAWDWAEGRPSRERPDLFPPGSVPGNPAYPTDEGRIAEAFAEACALGPRAVAEEELSATLCGEDSPLGDAEAWIRAHVYDAFVDGLGVDVAFAPMVITRASLWSGSLVDVRFVPASGRLAFLQFDRTSGGTAAPRLRLVDPVSVSVTELPVPAEAEDAQYIGLLGSDGDPIVWSAHPLRAWRVDPENGTATPLSLPDDPETLGLSGYVHGDTAWLQPYRSGAAATPYTLDLATGATGPLLTADGTVLAPGVALFGNGDRVSLSVSGRIDTWSFATATWGSVPRPAILTSDILPLSNGRVAGVYMARSGTRSVPIVGGTDAHVWTFPDAPCDATGWPDTARLLTLDDALYGVTDTDGGSIDLVRVEP